MTLRELSRSNSMFPGQLYLWLAVLIFGASSAVIRKLTEIGSQHSTAGQNPISFCNVLFVGNLCALVLLLALYGRHWNRANLSRLSRQHWYSLVTVTLLGGALAPALIFRALALTQVNNVVLIGRLEPPLTLALSVWLLRERVNRLEVAGAIVALIGVSLTLFLQPPSSQMMQIGMVSIGIGGLFAALGAIASAIATIVIKKQLTQVPAGIYSIFRTAISTLVFFCVVLVLYGSNHFMGVLSPFLWQWMLVYGAVIVVLGQSFWVRGLRATTASMASLVSSFTPIVGILAAYWILGEIPTQAQYVGGSIILIGLALSQIGIRQAAQHQSNLSQVERMKTEMGMGFKGI